MRGRPQRIGVVGRILSFDILGYATILTKRKPAAGGIPAAGSYRVAYPSGGPSGRRRCRSCLAPSGSRGGLRPLGRSTPGEEKYISASSPTEANSSVNGLHADPLFSLTAEPMLGLIAFVAILMSPSCCLIGSMFRSFLILEGSDSVECRVYISFVFSGQIDSMQG